MSHEIKTAAMYNIYAFDGDDLLNLNVSDWMRHTVGSVSFKQLSDGVFQLYCFDRLGRCTHTEEFASRDLAACAAWEKARALGRDSTIVCELRE